MNYAERYMASRPAALEELAARVVGLLKMDTGLAAALDTSKRENVHVRWNNAKRRYEITLELDGAAVTASARLVGMAKSAP